MASHKTPTAKLNILLVKPENTSFEDVLKDDHTLSEVPLKKSIGDAAALFVKAPHENPPSWAKFLAPVTTKNLQLANASSSAILFVQVQQRIFAVCFGHGRAELKPDATVNGFGLRVALNRVDPSKLRSVDARTLENGVTTRRLQTSRDADQSAFGLDVARDLLRHVVGQPDDPQFAKKVAGSDSLTIHAPITAGGLGEKCKQLVAAYNDTHYKKHFDWVDHLAEVTDPSLRDALDEKLARSFSQRHLDEMHLAATSVVDWERVEKFKLGGAGRTTFLDLDIDEYADAMGGRLADITPQKLKSYKVSAQFAGSESFFPQGSIYSSLVWETKLNGQLYAFVDGHWYEIDSSYANKVRKFVKDIPQPTASFLPHSDAGEKEGDYNERAAESSTELFLLDRALVTPDGGSTPIEFCDLFSKAKQLIHVKRKTRSATLSHLFAQGTVAAQLFVQDGEVRKQVKQIIRDKAPSGGFLQHIPDGRPKPEEYEVIYAIVTRSASNWPLSLPFFSQVNLMHSCKLLDGLGFRYALQRIDEV